MSNRGLGILTVIEGLKMVIKEIANEQEYRAIIDRLGVLFDNQPDKDSPEFEDMEMMVSLVEAWELRHHPI